MKRLFVLSAVLSMAMSSHADTFPYLSFQLSDDTTLSFGVESLSMTFTDSGSKLLVTDGTESKTLDVSDLRKMFFTDGSSTAISEITSSDVSTKVKAYTVSGVYVGTFSSLSALQKVAQPGMYVLKTNGKTLKTTVR